MTPNHRYYEQLAAAYVRGTLQHPANAALFATPLNEFTPGDTAALIALGQQHDLRLHRFKRAMDLPRVRKVLGLLRGLQPAHLLDIGSGRGAFLWPLLDAFLWLSVTAIDTLPHRVTAMQAVHAGGVALLTAQQADATALPFNNCSFDVVTMLEVLEHIPDTSRALREVCRVATRFVVLSMPSRSDNNPEHIHLFDQATLENHLVDCGAAKVSFDHVHNHMIVVARIEQ